MAQVDRFYIGQINGQGLQSDLKPYAIPDNAFVQLNNAYVFRGRVRKRFGSKLMIGTDPQISGLEQIQSRLKINLGTTNGAGNLSGTVPGVVTAGQLGQAFSVGSNFFTIYQVGAPATMLTTGPGTGTYNTTSGAYVITGAPITTTVYFYPAQPVMGLITFQSPDVNSEDIFAFDTQFAYEFIANGWSRLGTAIWTGGNADFFWGASWRGITNDETFLFVTNYVSADKIKFYNPSGNPLWTDMYPVVSNTNRLLTSRVILPFKDRLIALNTKEDTSGVQFSSPNATDVNTGNFNQTVVGAYALGDKFIVRNTIFTIASVAAGLQNMTVSSLPGAGTSPTAQFNYGTGNLVIVGNTTNLGQPVYYFSVTAGDSTIFGNRCRFSLNGDPTRTNGWIDIAPGLGGYIDAPTKEVIITAQFLRDRLIVYFESSTWELVYTSNQTLPFVWQQINTELGAESTFSQVPFDKVVLGVGNVGIHACNGSNVERIDDKIPDEVFKVHNDNNGIERVAGIRDYYTEMVYWTFPSEDRTSSFPFNNRIMTYNYKNGNWAFNSDSITSFGYFQSVSAGTSVGLTWSQATMTWQQANFDWNSASLQAKFRNVIAGNQEGYVFVIDPELSVNSQSIQITDLAYISGFAAAITAINHNLTTGDYVKVINAQGLTGLNGKIRQVVTILPDSFVLDTIGDTITGTYTGGGTLARVTPIDFKTKQYNFYADQGMNAYISRLDCFVDKTTNGQCTVDFFIASSGQGMISQSSLTGAMVGTSVLETSPYALAAFEQQQERLWHPVYFFAEGEAVQFRFYLSHDQIKDPNISESEFELHAIIAYATATSSRL